MQNTSTLKNSSIATRLWLSLVFVLTALTTANAQDVRGTIAGTIKDGSGAVVATAKVTARNTGITAETQGDVLEDGSYTIKLNPGVYDVRV